MPHPAPLSWKGGPSDWHPLQRSLQTSPAASSSLVCRHAPPPTPPAHGPLSPGSGGLCLPQPLLQPTPASGTTPGLPTPRWGRPENQKPPWDSCRAGCGLSLCQTRAQPPRGSLHVPGWQTLCLLACIGRCPALPGGEQLTWTAGAGRQASRLPQGTSVTREGQPQPAGTRTTPGRREGSPQTWGTGVSTHRDPPPSTPRRDPLAASGPEPRPPVSAQPSGCSGCCLLPGRGGWLGPASTGWMQLLEGSPGKKALHTCT